MAARRIEVPACVLEESLLPAQIYALLGGANIVQFHTTRKSGMRPRRAQEIISIVHAWV